MSVVHRDAGLLERGREMRRLGANIVVADFFDAGTASYLLRPLSRTSLTPEKTQILTWSPLSIKQFKSHASRGMCMLCTLTEVDASRQRP